MKKIIFIVCIGFVILFSSCQNQNKKQVEAIEGNSNDIEMMQTVGTIQQENSIIDKDYFKEFDKIELAYYPNSKRAMFTMGCDTLLKNGVFQVDSLQKRVVLEKEQEEKLNKILLQNKGMSSPSDCYRPQHAVLFYRKEKVESFIEICFDCNQSCSSFSSYYLRDIQLESLKPLFDKILKN